MKNYFGILSLSLFLSLAACTQDSSTPQSDELDAQSIGALAEAQAKNVGFNPLKNSNAPTEFYSPEGGSKDTPVASGRLSDVVAKEEKLGNHKQSFESFLSQVLCRETLTARLKGSSFGGNKWVSLDQWNKRLTSGFDGSVTFVSPTSVPGIWLRVHFYLNREASVEVITPSQVAFYEFDSLPNDASRLDCSKMRKTFKNSAFGPANRKARDKYFTDHDLIRLLKKNKVGILYLWSPNMSYSYSGSKGVLRNGISTLREAISQLGSSLGSVVALDIAMDPAATEQQVASIMANPQKRGLLDSSMLKPARSLEVFMRGMDHHYPAMIVYAHGRIGRRMLPGVATPRQYRKFIQTEVREIENSLKKKGQ